MVSRSANNVKGLHLATLFCSHSYLYLTLADRRQMPRGNSGFRRVSRGALRYDIPWKLNFEIGATKTPTRVCAEFSTSN